MTENAKDQDMSQPSVDPTSTIHTVIIECSMFNHVDVVGVKTLQTIVTDYDKVGVRVLFANCIGLY